MGTVRAEQLAEVISFLRNERQGVDISFPDVIRLAEVMAESLRSVFKSFDDTIYSELGDMARDITALKTELSELRLADTRYERIPSAGRELDAIVEATETATDTIMTAAEVIMAADPADAEAYKTTVSEKVVEIFEACSFQDITGQRISKVVHTLALLDTRITTLVDRLKLLHVSDMAPVETADDIRRRELILHGPQMKGEGVSQSDVDALLA
jgi:chemotaxis protein CheZ